ncbi:MAG TPA: cell division protein FtsL [Steroidobacteraceae bacterium]|nr:cell division protein FtsL [Steroidobacteraceae bacterium]
MNAMNKLLVAISAMLLLASAIGVIWTKHQSRTVFIELQRLQAERDRLDIEWGQLKIQQSYSATPGRVEQVAFVDLKMVTPRPSDVRIVQPESRK